MDIDFKLEVDHRWIYERPYKVTLTRGAKGDYRWEIEVRSGDSADVVIDVEGIDKDLREKYGGLEPLDQEE